MTRLLEFVPSAAEALANRLLRRPRFEWVLVDIDRKLRADPFSQTCCSVNDLYLESLYIDLDWPHPPSMGTFLAYLPAAF
jgi:hypothetical protein